MVDEESRSQTNRDGGRFLMNSSIIVPLDGSTQGECALPYAFSIARRSEVSVHLVHMPFILGVLRASTCVLSTGQQETDYCESGREYIDGLRERTRFDQDLDIEIASIEGNAADAFAQYARDVKVSLVVMSIEGREDVERIFVDDSFHRPTRISAPPLLLVHPESGGQEHENIEVQLKRLLLPMENTVDVLDIAEPALALSTLFDGECTILHVVDDAGIDSYGQRPRAVAEKYATETSHRHYAPPTLERYAECLRKQGRRAALKIVENPYPADGILEEMESSEVDWAAISCRRRLRLSRGLLGSTAARIVQYARKPVLVCFSEHE
jgi:nucleotide-binding universal stress UspA family protein